MSADAHASIDKHLYQNSASIECAFYDTGSFIFNKDYFSAKSISKLRRLFIEAKPFRHVVIDGLFQPKFLDAVLADFTADLGDWTHRDSAQERKRGTRANARLAPACQLYFDAVHRGEFVQFLSAVSGIEGLVPDPSLFGGGLHEIPSGGHFGVHIDFNFHPVTQLNNRLVFITYLNKGWVDAFGGSLELWDAETRACVEKVVPVFGRSILFSQSSKSLHGHPDPVSAPAGQVRRSLAAYYYTNGRADDLSASHHSTEFMSPPTFGKWGRVITVAKYVSPMLVDVMRFVARAGGRRLRKSNADAVQPGRDPSGKAL